MIVVAPFAGAWIEITVALFDANEDVVAPFAGAWIEIQESWAQLKEGQCRSVRRSVD